MRLLQTAMVISSIYFMASALATPTPVPGVEMSPSEVMMVTLHANGIWELQEDTVFYPIKKFSNGLEIDLDELPDEDRPFIALNRFEPVAVEFLGNGEVAIDLLLSPEEASDLPDRIVISIEEFESAGFKFLEKGGVFDLYTDYSIYQVTKEAATSGVSKSKKRDHFQGYGGCVAYVCRRVGCSGTVGDGKGMVSYLIRKKGWKSVSCGSPRRGDVASWSGGSHGKGHTAIWNGSGWCYDKGCHDPGKKYRKTGCARK